MSEAGVRHRDRSLLACVDGSRRRGGQSSPKGAQSVVAQPDPNEMVPLCRVFEILELGPAVPGLEVVAVLQLAAFHREMQRQRTLLSRMTLIPAMNTRHASSWKPCAVHITGSNGSPSIAYPLPVVGANRWCQPFLANGSDPPVFLQVPAPDPSDLQALVEQIAARVGEALVRRGLIERDIENAWLSSGAEPGPLDDMIGHSITYRIAVGPRAGQKLLTLQTVPPRLQGPEGDPNGAARAGGFSSLPRTAGCARR